MQVIIGALISRGQEPCPAQSSLQNTEIGHDHTVVSFRLALNSFYSCFSVLSAGITGVCTAIPDFEYFSCLLVGFTSYSKLSSTITSHFSITL